MIIVLSGLPGTGKSTLAAAIARRVSGVVLNKDSVRAALFPPEFVEYSTQQDDFCIGVMLEVAEYLLARDPHLKIFIDGRVFARNSQVRLVTEAAEKIGTPWRVIECVCSESTALSRLESDAASGNHPAKNRGPSLYHELRARFEPVPQPKLVVDTDESLETCAARVEAWLT